MKMIITTTPFGDRRRAKLPKSSRRLGKRKQPAEGEETLKER
jgi:hypothetical protein